MEVKSKPNGILMLGGKLASHFIILEEVEMKTNLILGESVKQLVQTLIHVNRLVTRRGMLVELFAELKVPDIEVIRCLFEF